MVPRAQATPEVPPERPVTPQMLPPRGAPAPVMPPPPSQIQVQPPARPAAAAPLAPPPNLYNLYGAIPPSVQRWGDVTGYNLERGLVGLGGMAMDVAGLPGWAAQTALARAGIAPAPPSPFGVSQWINRQYEAMPQAQPQTGGEALAANIASAAGANLPFLPFGPAVAGTRALIARYLAESAGMGAGQRVAQVAHAGPVGEAVGALVGGLTPALPMAIARGGVALARAGGKTLQDELAGQLFARLSQAPTTLGPRLATAPRVGLPAAERTTAMVAQDPALMRAELAVRATPGGAKIAAVEAQRNQAIADALRAMQTRLAPLTTAQRGQAIRGILREQERLMTRRVDELYDAARRAPGTASLQPVITDLARLSRQHFGPGGAPAPAVWKRIRQQILDESHRPVNAEFLINMDRQLGNEAGIASAAGDHSLASALGDLREAVEKLNPNAAYTAAKTYRAQVGRVMGRDVTGAHVVGEIMKTDRYGMPTTPDDKIVAKIMSQGPSAVRQVLNAADEAARAAARSGTMADVNAANTYRAAIRMSLKDAFLQGAERQRLAGPTATGAPGGVATYSPAKWAGFWQKNEQIAQQLFDPNELTTLRQVTDQLGETALVQQTATAKGSHTVQNALHIAQIAGGESPTVAHVLGAIFRGRVNPNDRVGRMAVGLFNKAPTVLAALTHGATGGIIAHYLGGEKLANVLSGRADEAIRALAQDAFSNPTLAKELIKKATDAGLLRVLQQSAQNDGAFAGLLRRALTAAATANAATGRPFIP